MALQIKVLGIPCEVDFTFVPAEPSVGLYADYEDIEFFNVKNGSRMNWLFDKVGKLDKWREVYEAISEAEAKHRNPYG